MAGGGIGEAALIGAAFGGAKAVATGEDPLKGALIGGAMGGVTGGMFGGASNVAATTTAAEAENIAVEQAMTGGVGIGNFGVNEAAHQSLIEAGAYGAPSFMQGVDPGGINTLLNAAPEAVQSAGITAYNPNAVSMMQNLGTPAAPVELAPVDLATNATNPINPQEDLVRQAAYNPSGTAGIRETLGLKPGSLPSQGLDYWDAQDKLGKAGIAGMAGYGIGALTAPLPVVEPIPEEKSKLAGYDRNTFTPYSPVQPQPYYRAQYAEGGIANLNNQYPQSQQFSNDYASSIHNPISTEVVNSGYEQQTNAYTGEPVGYAPGGSIPTPTRAAQNNIPLRNIQAERAAAQNDILAQRNNGFKMANYQRYFPTQSASIGGTAFMPMMKLLRDKVAETTPNNAATYNQAKFIPQAPVQANVYRPRYAEGGIASLGGYAAGGNPQLLAGPGDGMSDSIPASIGNKQPARLAQGEFVVPADVVSHLGNGSTDAGAKHLYRMMDKVRKARTGNKKQGKQINPNKFVMA
jgi:hypothetical protein